MSDFLAENNICGQTILQLVSRGNAIVAELLRLKDYIPKIYSYFKIAEAHEQKIENSESLTDLDEEFRDNHIDIIKRFYMVFESIHTYVTDLNHFLEELNDGLYIHQTLESIFMDMEGKQLMSVLLVSYYRYTPQRRDTQSCIDEVCKLLRDTGYTTKKPPNYPEDFFKRIPVQSTYIEYVIGRLRSDDIYGQISVYPLSLNIEVQP
ncbi:hypothetical protein NQ317_014942 [Molorchus minor]|uniref:WASH complex subunit strumpellin n=1 Tax=Molorchus minor TaxID=1323400 RepID=A0ABQ9K1L3_9CUCU|nr:hypothetical protein NQ317_014942 [Molorchus minor]